MTGDVFEEDPLWAALDDDACDIWPEVAGVVGATALSGRAEGLAGISGQDHVESPAKGAGIEVSQIIPDWGRCEVSCALGGDEDGAGPVLPLDKSAGVISGLCEHEAHIQPSAACAEG